MFLNESKAPDIILDPKDIKPAVDLVSSIADGYMKSPENDPKDSTPLPSGVILRASLIEGDPARPATKFQADVGCFFDSAVKQMLSGDREIVLVLSRHTAKKVRIWAEPATEKETIPEEDAVDDTRDRIRRT